MRKKMAAAGIGAALLLGSIAGAAAPAAAGPGDGPCGYGRSATGQSYYNNCNPRRVEVQIDYKFGNARACVDGYVKQGFNPQGFNPITNIFYVKYCD